MLDEGTRISLVLYADSFWLFAKSPDQLEAMTKHWLEILTVFGWSVPLEVATWCSTQPDDVPARVSLSSTCIKRAKRNKVSEFLGRASLLTTVSKASCRIVLRGHGALSTSTQISCVEEQLLGGVV